MLNDDEVKLISILLKIIIVSNEKCFIKCIILIGDNIRYFWNGISFVVVMNMFKNLGM